MEKNNRILYYVNSDWYFCLHWIDRAVAAKKAGYRIDVLAPITEESYKEEILSQGLKFHNIDMHRTSINPFNELRALFQTIMKVIELKTGF